MSKLPGIWKTLTRGRLVTVSKQLCGSLSPLVSPEQRRIVIVHDCKFCSALLQQLQHAGWCTSCYTVMTATDRIAAAGRIDPSYSPVGADIQYSVPWSHACMPHLERFVRFTGLARVPNIHRQTRTHAHIPRCSNMPHLRYACDERYIR